MENTALSRVFLEIRSWIFGENTSNFGLTTVDNVTHSKLPINVVILIDVVKHIDRREVIHKNISKSFRHN